MAKRFRVTIYCAQQEHDLLSRLAAHLQLTISSLARLILRRALESDELISSIRREIEDERERARAARVKVRRAQTD